MTDKKQQIIPPVRAGVPARVVAAPALPSLPSSSGKWFGSPTTILDADRRYVEIHAAYLQARETQTRNMTAFVRAREELGLALNRLRSLDELCDHATTKGKMERAGELKVLALKHQIEELQAKAELAAAQQYLASFSPPPPERPASPTPSAAGLTPAEVDELFAALPELSPELRRTMSYLLNARMTEKQS